MGGTLLTENNQRDVAKTYFNTAHAVNPQETYALHVLPILDTYQTNAFYLGEQEPYSEQDLLSRSQAAYTQGNYQQALGLAFGAFLRNPYNLETNTLLRDTYIKMTKVEKAAGFTKRIEWLQTYPEH